MHGILIVGRDEQIVAADLEIKLTRMGYEVIGLAASGDEALQIAEQGRPDVVLMDIQLRGPMDGTEAARVIQRGKLEPRSSSSLRMPASSCTNRSTCTPPGICLTKPFSTHQLKTALAAVVKEPHGD